MDWIRIFPVVRTVWNWWRSRLGLNREHDIAIFKTLDAIANEPKVDEILNSRIFTSDLRLEDVHVINDFIRTLRRYENQYLDPTIQLRAGELAWEMAQLMSLVARTFFSVPGGWLKFYPDRIDEDVYRAEWKELNEKLEKAWEAYKTYRLAVKDRLMV